jgi:hypothetical protein
MKLEEILEEISKLSVQEKKDGYASILHHLFIEYRSSHIRKEMMLILANILHEMPPFLARDLEGFNDSWFWEKAEKYDLLIGMMFTWFMMGVQLEQTRGELISK